MANEKFNKDVEFIIYLTIDGTSYEEVEVKVADPNKTIRNQINSFVQMFKLPKLDNGGNPIQYLLGQMLEDCGEPEILDFEDEDGHEQCLMDYNIQSGDHLHLIYVPIAGGRPQPPQPGSRCTSGSEQIVSHNATGRDRESGIFIDKSKPETEQKHLIPQKTSFVKNIFRKIQKLFSRQDIVNSTVFAPFTAEKGEVMSVQVLFYKDSQYSIVEKRAKSVDPEANKRNSQVLGIPLKRGDVVTAHLSFFCPNLNKDFIAIEENDKQIVWNSNVEDIVFSVFIDSRFNRKLLDAKVVIKLREIPVAEMKFQVRIVNEKESLPSFTDIHVTKLDKVFISYSHADADKVQYISETCRAVKCNYFFDRHSLNPGDIYPEKIFKYIDNANLFILCWSKNAATSEWVEKERKRALENLKERSQSLHFYPINIPPKAELPDDMKETINFGELS